MTAAGLALGHRWHRRHDRAAQIHDGHSRARRRHRLHAARDRAVRPLRRSSPRWHRRATRPSDAARDRRVLARAGRSAARGGVVVARHGCRVDARHPSGRRSRHRVVRVVRAREEAESTGLPALGSGAIEGVAGPESANNAAAQTSFVPLLTLGLPSGPVVRCSWAR